MKSSKIVNLSIQREFKSTDFPKIANMLLNNFLLELPLLSKKRTFRICEVEFYLWAKDSHEDNYVHCSEDQLQWNSFYFHRHKNGTYKSGTYKGMDLSFGIPEMGIYFGVLIRTIMDLSTGEIIEGPCRSVNKILELYQCHDVKEFRKKFKQFEELKIFGEEFPLRLIPRGKFKKEKVNFFKKHPEKYVEDQMYSGPRIGLSNKFPAYKDKCYRYVVFKNKIKKKRKTLELIDF